MRILLAHGGRDGGTLQLLADKLVELRVVDAVSYQTVRRVLAAKGNRSKSTAGAKRKGKSK